MSNKHAWYSPTQASYGLFRYVLADGTKEVLVTEVAEDKAKREANEQYPDTVYVGVVETFVCKVV